MNNRKELPINGKAENNGTMHEEKTSDPGRKIKPLSPLNLSEQKNGSLDGVDLSQLLHVLTEVSNGNFNIKMPIDQVGFTGKIYDRLNEIISLNQQMVEEFARAGNTIGRQGKLTQRL